MPTAINKTGKVSSAGKFMLTCNLFAALSLLVSQAAPLVSPERFWYMELMAFAYPFLLFINLLFLAYWGFRRHRFFFISAAIILMGYDKLVQLYQPHIFSMDVKHPKDAVKVMSYNVRLFDLYNWTGNKKSRDKIIRMLQQEHPDILCLQEYFHADKGDFNNNDTLRDVLHLNHSTITYGITLRKIHHWGLATFSKYPIIDEGKVFFEEGKTNFGIYSDLIIEKDTVRVYNVHLQSNHFKEQDYHFIANPDSGDNDELIRGTKGILNRIKKSVSKRSQQVDELALHISNSPYPVLLCGDFNDPPFTYAYQSLRKVLRDAYIEKGKGFGATYIGLPVKFRIDYILHSPEIAVHTYQTKIRKYSDHYPITAWISIDKNPKK
jgi:endonuclease/exonuclease/phosphatase family metal-dependent hydrolase